MKIETKVLHSGYKPENGGPGTIPIVQSTTYRFDSCDHVAALFDKPTEFMYSRFANPTCDAVEKKIADLEGGIGCMLTSSGQAASLLSVLNLCCAGDSFIASSSIYGGTINLFGFTLKKLGIECIWVDVDASYEEICKAIKPNTKCIFGETIANPALTVFDFETWAKAAHDNNLPLIVDNTFATPVLCRPFEWGADIVVHSTTKYMDGHAVQGGGCIVDSGNFDWEKAYKATGKFADMVEPDDAQSAFYLNMGLETLPVRMERYCQNARKVAEFFKTSDKIAKVTYPGIPGDKYYERAQKYLPNGTCGVISSSIKGGRAAAVRFMDALKLACDEVHVADIRTCVLHPASATHRQLTDEQLVAAGIDGGMVRVSVGLENVDDIIEDLKGGLAAI